VKPCREWQGPRTPKGYGRTSRKGQEWGVHRLVWTLANGSIPAGMCICHRCDNPSCFLLEHLFLGTVADNNRDMVKKGRLRNGAMTADQTSCMRGHLWEDSAYVRKSTGRRECRTCANDQQNSRRSLARSSLSPGLPG
jgi:hypothetical protein